jgi:hypothetical protein
MVARSLCAQYEFLCTKHAPRFLKKLSVSYIKLLLIPATILKHGWTDELSIDSRMKAIWGAVGVTGGAGGNPEEWAIIGYLRSLALLEARYALDEENRRRGLFFQFQLCPRFQFHHPISNADSGRRRKNTYISFLKYMYAGNVGAVLADAFHKCAPNWDEQVVAEVRSLSLWSLRFFERLCLTGEDPSKCFNTFLYDVKKPQRFGAIPRVGSNAIVEGLNVHPLMIRIMVSGST